MTSIELPVELRSIRLPWQFRIDMCSAKCLLATRKLESAIPAGLGSGHEGREAFQNALFRTSEGTVIKRKCPAWISSPALEEKVFASLAGVPGIVALKARCRCSIEMAEASGQIVEIRDSVHYRNLASKFRLFRFQEVAQVSTFFAQACDILAGLNRNGLGHVDPAYWNFLFDGQATTLIDVDDVVEHDEASAASQALRFAEFMLAPLQRLPFASNVLATLPGAALERGIFPFSKAALPGIVDMANRASDSTQQHLALHNRITHQSLINSELHRTYDRHLRELRTASEAAAAREQEHHRALMEKEAVIQGLLVASADAESRSLQEKEAVLQGLRVASGDAESRSLQEKAAIEQLHLASDQALGRNLEEKEAVIQELKGALDAYHRAFPLIRFFTLPVRALLAPVRFVFRRLRVVLTPKLGSLHHHPPRELLLPPRYSQPRSLKAYPRICIVTPSFRQAAFIERTIASVLDQGYPELRYFVQDGGSDDGTVEILQRYAGRLAGWDSRPDSGQTEAINRGFARVEGEIMAWLNSDDLLLPGALACVAEYFNTHPEIDVIYGHRILIDENDREIGRWILPPHDDAVLSWADYVPQETLFWRRRIWDRAGARVDESFRFAMDWDLLVRFRDANAKFARLPRFLGGFRIHPQQKTSAVISDIGFKEMDRIRERALGRLPSRVEIARAVLPYMLRHVASDFSWRVRNRLGAP